MAEGDSVSLGDQWFVPDLAELLDEISRGIRKYVVVEADQLSILSLWVVHTWALDAFDYTPYLDIRGPTSSIGKTLLAEVLEQLVRCGFLTGSVSESVLFRYIEDEEPTLFLDELDKALQNKNNGEAILQVLDTGFKRSGKALRNVPEKGGKWIAKGFSTFCPKAFQTIRMPPGELANRSVPIRMKRKLPSEKIARKRDRKLRAEFEPLRDRAERWVVQREEALRARVEGDGVALPEELSDRQRDILEPLFAIADEAGGDWPKKAREAALAIMRQDEEQTHLNELLLHDVHDAFEAAGKDRLLTTDILERLNAIEDRPWAGWNKGKGFNHWNLASRLKDFGGRPTNIKLPVEGGGAVRKGYVRSDLEDAFQRHIHPLSPENLRYSATDPKNHEDREKNFATGSGEPPATGTTSCGTSSATFSPPLPLKPLQEKAGSGVADVSGGEGVGGCSCRCHQGGALGCVTCQNIHLGAVR